MQLKEEFVLRAKEPGACMAQLCREFGISRQNGYKWLKRFEKEGIEGLRERSRRPLSSPVATSGEMVLKVIELRGRYGWGPKKLRDVLLRRFKQDVPRQRTIARILARAGAVKKRRRAVAQAARPADAPAPKVEASNDLWTVDFKGWWRARNGERCEPLTIRDAFSRYFLSMALLRKTNTREVRSVFERLFERYGLPTAILSDNGSPFACTRALWGLTELSAWWISLGIQVLHSRPGCPQDNGAHERLHVDVRWGLQEPGADTLEAQQRACDLWRHEFNHVRPHEALNMRTPAEVYRPSQRRPASIAAASYPAAAVLRPVLANGHIWLGSRQIFVSRALRKHTIALLIDAEGTRAKVMFHHLAIDNFDLARGSPLSPMSGRR